MSEKYPYRRWIRIPGTTHEVEVKSDEECEKADHVLCILLSEAEEMWARHPETKGECIESTCMDCHKPVARDARGPKKPPSICWHCMVKRPLPGEDTFPA